MDGEVTQSQERRNEEDNEPEPLLLHIVPRSQQESNRGGDTAQGKMVAPAEGKTQEP